MPLGMGLTGKGGILRSTHDPASSCYSYWWLPPVGECVCSDPIWLITLLFCLRRYLLASGVQAQKCRRRKMCHRPLSEHVYLWL